MLNRKIYDNKDLFQYQCKFQIPILEKQKYVFKATFIQLIYRATFDHECEVWYSNLIEKYKNKLHVLQKLYAFDYKNIWEYI